MPYTQKGVYIIFEYKTNFEREAFRFGMVNLRGLHRINKACFDYFQACEIP